MTVPAQRGAESGGPELDFIVESLRRLEDSVSSGFRDMRAQMSALPTVYVSQREFDRVRDDLTLDIGQERAERQRDIGELKTAAEATEKARIAGFRWLVGLTVTATLSAAGVLVALIALLAR